MPETPTQPVHSNFRDMLTGIASQSFEAGKLQGQALQQRKQREKRFWTAVTFFLCGLGLGYGLFRVLYLD